MERREPGAAHHALVADLHGILERYTMMPAVERVACMSQALGHLLADVPEGYSVAVIMQVVSRNIEQGNETATRTLGGLASLGGPTGLD